MSDSLMDIKQTAAYLKMNKMTIYKLAREGKIPAFKVASEWRFKKELLDSWLMSQLKGKPELEHLHLGKEKSGHKTVLVVDDEKLIRDYFEQALPDYRVIKASGGEEALAIIKHDRPDVVLLDIRMPGINGIETLRRIKEYDTGITVIMHSAFADFQTNMEAVRLGAFSSVAKPFDLGEMKNLLAEASKK
jgi:two-component system response regulator (stage 0 sporulation protein F)